MLMTQYRSRPVCTLHGTGLDTVSCTSTMAMLPEVYLRLVAKLSNTLPTTYFPRRLAVSVKHTLRQ